MNCRKVRDMLALYLEGDYTGRLKDEIEAHLGACESCRNERDQIAAAWRMTAGYRVPEVGTDFVPKLMKRIREEEVAPGRVVTGRPRFILRPLMPALASLAVVVLTVVLVWHGPARQMLPGLMTPLAMIGPAVVVSDEEIIRDLDLLENAELLRNAALLNDLDVVENIDENGSNG